MLEKIFDPLGGGGVISTAKAIGRVLQLALELDAREGIAGREILRRNGDQKSAVDVLAVARKFAHAVCHDALFLRRSSDDLAAGADAEREHAAPLFRVAGELVRRGWEAVAARRLLILR